MKFNTHVNIHNRFDIAVRNAETGEIEQKALAENIVHDRAYTRICSFLSYFDRIFFGGGTGEPAANRSTLFQQIGYKDAVTEQLVRAYPVSTWTKSIRLGTGDNNGATITEVGISDNQTTTQVNTHAIIKDSEGNPIALEKTPLKIIDIYATVYITIYDVDRGLLFDGNGLRDYLTGASMASDKLGVGLAGNFDDFLYLTSSRAPNSDDKSVSTSVRFNVEHFNKEIRFIRWDSVGLRCELPRPGVFDSFPKTGVNLGAGDGVKTTFSIPQKYVKDVSVYVNGIISVDWAFNALGDIVFNTPVADGLPVTANYTCVLVPKDIDHVFDVTMQIRFGGGQPTPVMPPLVDTSPGSKVPIGGDTTYGFFGEVPAADLINGGTLCNLIGLTAGTLQNSEEPWLKFALGGNILFVAKKNIRHTVSWNDINGAGAIYAEKIITIGGIKYAVTLMSSAEWDKLMYPIHVDYGQWHQYTNADLNVGIGDGRYCWTSTVSGSNRVNRGNSSVSGSNISPPSYSGSNYGFRPVLRKL